MEDDSRFSRVLSDPKFRRLKKQDRKVKVDKRFQSLIKDTKAQSKCKTDERGRPLKTTKKDDLKRFYDMSDSDEEEPVKVKGKEQQKAAKGKKQPKGKKVSDDEESDINEEESDEDIEEEDDTEEEEDTDEEEEEEEDDDSEEEEDDEDEDESDSDDDSEEEDDEEEEVEAKKSKKSKKKKKEIAPDFSRGIGNISSSDEDDDDNDDGVKTKNAEDVATEGLTTQTETNVPTVEESTRRLAVCNMNWDYVRASDLLMLCNSFKPQFGTVISVKIYPTEFGLEKMREETLDGPKGIAEPDKDSKAPKAKSSNQNKTKKVIDKKAEAERLRQYELSRLRYYVAVVECDSVETADQIYANCDGLEFEKSGTKLDFRYIPDDVTFDHTPKSVATSLPASGTYKPPHYIDTALSKTKVKLTWETTSPRRLAVTQMDLRKVKNIEDEEEKMLEFVAPYNSEDEDDGGSDPYEGLNLDWSYVTQLKPTKTNADEMRKLLLNPAVDEDDDAEDGEIDKEFTWELGLQDTLEDAAKEKQKKEKLANMTVFAQYQLKKKEQKREKERKKRQEKRKKAKEEPSSEEEEGADLETFFVGEDDEDDEKSNKKETEQDKKQKRPKESLKQRAKKRKRELEENSLKINETVLSDPRFAELTESHFAMDPSDPKFSKKQRKF